MMSHIIFYIVITVGIICCTILLVLSFISLALAITSSKKESRNEK